MRQPTISSPGSMCHVRSPSLPCVDRSSSLDNLDDERTWRRKYLQFDRVQRTLTFYSTDVCAEFFFFFFSSRLSSVMSIISVLTGTHIIASSSFSVGRRERDTYAHIECLSMDNTSLVELISSFAPMYIDQRSGERNDDGITSLAERRELLISSSSFSVFVWRNKLRWSIWIVKWFLYRRRRLLHLRLHLFVHHLIRVILTVNGRRSAFFVRVTCYNLYRNTCLPRYPKPSSRQPRRRRRRATPPPLMRRKQRH